MHEILDSEAASRCVLWSDRDSGLRAVLVIDSVSLGPAAGGIRTWRYPNVEAAVRDAARLARAMTIKCSISGLDAGGGKAVVLDHDGLDRERAFARMGAFVDELDGLFRTAGDLGTTSADLEVMARHCRFVHTEEGNLAAAVARGALRCIEACAEARARTLASLRVAVQGCGAIGAALARVLRSGGAEVLVADVDRARAHSLAEEIGARVVGADEILIAEADVVAPCAIGGVLTPEVVRNLRAWAVCGAANNILAEPGVARLLLERDVLHVPDVVASAGAVVDGIGRTVMNLADRTPLIDALGTTARDLLAASAETGRTPHDLALERALERVERAESPR
jgi:leucine dehydrogenase